MTHKLTGRLAFSVPMIAAVFLPVALAYSRPPSNTALNQLLAVVGWGFVVAWAGQGLSRQAPPWRSIGPMLAALAVLFLVSLAAGLLGPTAGASSFAFAAMVAAAVGVMVVAAASAAGEPIRHALAMRAFHRAFLLAGTVSAAIAVVQIFWPAWTGSDLIAGTGTGGGGRAVGNLRQSNHLSTLLLFAAAAAVPVAERGHLRRGAVWLAMMLLMLGVVLSGSRTGTVGVLVLAMWGGLDRRLSRPARELLLACPVLYGLAWLGVLGWSEYVGASLGAIDRLSSPGGDSTANRMIAWRNALELIALAPWRGVGFGEFNFALSLTPFEHRSTESPTNAHNLPLHLAVELGLPLATAIVALLVASLWLAWRRSAAMAGPAAVETRAAFVMMVLIAIHSQLEYPLWYAYFLLPTAWAMGACLAAKPAPDSATQAGSAVITCARSRAAAMRVLSVVGIVMIGGGLAALVDYLRLASVFMTASRDTPPATAMAAGQKSWFFAHHADYAAAVTARHYSEAPLAFSRAPHYVLDGQMLRAWSRALAQQGDLERARHVAQRLGELGTAQALAFFAPCHDPSVAQKPYQCTAPSSAMDWRDFH